MDKKENTGNRNTGYWNTGYCNTVTPEDSFKALKKSLEEK